MAIKKQYPKGKEICRVTFDVPKAKVNGVKKANVVGEFNNWSTSATPMKRQKNGAFKATLDLPKGSEYQFRYLFDNIQWENDGEADKYINTPYADAKNSVIIV